MKEHGKWRSQWGQAMVETALTMLLLLTVFLGTIEFGLMLHQNQMVTHAAREGARAAAVHKDDAYVKALVGNAIDGLDSTDLDIVIDPPETEDPRAQGSSVTVTVTVKTHIISGIIQAFSPPAQVRGTATMRVE